MNRSVVVFDMDGTLLDADSNVIGGERTVELLGRLQDAGCTMAICTGRLDHDIVRAGARFGLDFKNRISQHGAVMISGSTLRAELMDKDEAREILTYIEDSGAPIRVEMNTVANRYWHSDRDPDFPKELYDSHVIKSDFFELIECQPVVLFLLIGEERDLAPIAEHVRATCTRTQAVMSSSTSLELMSVDVSKGQAIESLYPGCDVYAIGDAPNDYGMFDVARVGYLVSDAECPYDVVRCPSIAEALEDIASRVLG
ncbi:HAD-IIB family hydrolase [Collinsella intestinalis]|uniref:HAD-IIB family hydrolase n=1 Tax=Collinsella intestinalis TaxID=147207 RepID=UPI001DFABE20|nr:HAD-IIB family hydrolase [Collinsella intestinalis]